MMKQLFPFSLILILFSCKSTLVETKSPDTQVLNNHYVFQNDTILVEYSFWENKGQMEFFVTNKLKKPLYLDLKKCSFLLRNRKYDYWKGSEIRTTTTSSVYKYSGSSRTSVSISDPERIEFLPPGSKEKFSTFLIVSINTKIDLDSTMIAHNNKSIEFDRASTPLYFSSYLTYSTTEKFEHESYIHNNFYVSKLSKISANKIYYENKPNQTSFYYK
jgi:hypothetical protein